MLDWKPAFKASTALMITSLTTFSSGFDELSQGFSYFVSLAVLFFHPARTVGAMVESVLCCAIGLAVGYFIASSCLIVVEYYDQSGNSIAEAHIIAILVLFLTTFCLAFIRAKYSSKRQVIATACSLVHILTFVTITQMGMEETLTLLPVKINAIVLCMMTGTIISFLVSLLCFPETASYKTLKSLVFMLDSFKDIIDFTKHEFLLKMVNEEVTEDLKVLVQKLKSLDSRLTSLSNSKFESYFEPLSRISRFREHYHRIIAISESLILHFASLISTMSSMWVLKDANEMNKTLYQQFFKKTFQEIQDVLFQANQCLELCSEFLALDGDPDREMILHFESLHKQMFQSLQNFQEFEKSELSFLSHDLDMKSYQIYFFVFGVQEITREILTLMDSIRGLIDKETLKLNHSFNLGIWESISSFFKDIKPFQIRFALKTAFAITLMSIPAFLEETKHTFYQYRLSWAMSSAIVVLTYSVGGTSSASWYRILGTVGGVLMSILIWITFPDNPVGLFISFGIISVPAFYFRFNSKYPKVHQIFLLTFTIIILQKYSSLEDPVFDKTYSIFEIAFRRGFSVSLGVMIGIFVSRNIWPYHARTAVREGISQVYQDISKLLVDILNIINNGQGPNLLQMKEITDLELRLRISYSEIGNFLKETSHESFRFPLETYSIILSSIQKILNRFSSIRMGISHDEFPHSSIKDFDHIDKLYTDMIDQVLLHFYVLSGAMKLTVALPPRLSDAQGSRRRLLEAISDLPHPHPPFYIAYVLEDVIEELAVLEELTRSLFGNFASLRRVDRK